MSPNETEAVLHEFLVNDLLYDKGLESLGPEDSLLEQGLLDSMGILRLMSFCEETFGVAIPDKEVVPDNLESIRAIANLVDRHRGAAG
jgi:acyl carrier protein